MLYDLLIVLYLAIQSSSESDGNDGSKSSDYPTSTSNSTSTSRPGIGGYHKIIYTLDTIHCYNNIGGTTTTVSDISNTTTHSNHSDVHSDQELSGESQREYL